MNQPRPLRSSSLGATPAKHPLSRSRATSSQPVPLEVRCACQFFQSDSLIPERINPIGSRPPSRVDSPSSHDTNFQKHFVNENSSRIEEEESLGSLLSFGKASGPDYYGETNDHFRPIHETEIESLNKENLRFENLQTFPVVENTSIPSINVAIFKRENILGRPLTNFPVAPPSVSGSSMIKGQFSSQKSLDRYSTSVLLSKYRPKSQSHAPSLQGSTIDIRNGPKMTKTVSFDYGKPLVSATSKNAVNENPNYDQYHRMSPMVFPIRDRLQKLDRMSANRDHEYEPIGPQQWNDDDDQQMESSKRKGSDTIDANAEKKFLRTPTQDSADDNVSAQDFQDNLENRFFRTGIEPIDVREHIHPEPVVDEATIIDDDDPVQRDAPRKRNFMSSAQDHGRNFNKKIRAQAGMLKTTLNNKMKRKPKEKPVAVEVQQTEEEEIVVDPNTQVFTQEEAEIVTVVNVQSAEPTSKSKSSIKMPNFAKNIRKASLPKFKKPEIPKITLDRPKMMPDLKMGGRFTSLRKLGRSKSLKETSETTDSASVATPEIVSAEPSKKRFDFGTYPRLIKDKFKRSKLPEPEPAAMSSDRSVRSDTPPAEIEFEKVSQTTFAQRGPVASRWMDEDSGKYHQFDSEMEYERESSIERRMRLDFNRRSEEREEIEAAGHLLTEEQRQLDEMDKENQEIHFMAKQERFRKPFVERQESDVVSEDDKLLWSGMLNKDTSKVECFDDDEPNALQLDDGYKFSLDEFKNAEVNRSSTPQTNVETQSSGSSGTRRRKGFIDDEDDDYFMREKRISNEMQVGDYINSGIKEGLSVPEDNALAMGSREFTPDKPTRSLRKRKNQNKFEDQEVVVASQQHQYDDEMSRFSDFYKTFPPSRPNRKHKRSLQADEELDDEEIDLNIDQEVPENYMDEMDDEELFYHHQNLKGLEHPDLIFAKEDMSNSSDYKVTSNLPVPPTPPRRRKKKMVRDVQYLGSYKEKSALERPIAMKNEEVIVFRSQNEIPLAQQEHFKPPTPTPRRTRSRSQVSAHTLDDADSFKKDSFSSFNLPANGHDYATVKKEIPSRPVRRKRSTKSLGDRQFATMPLMRRGDHNDDDEVPPPPPRPTRNYSTIIPVIPDKPPRRKSSTSLADLPKPKTRDDDDDYEEIVDLKFHDERLKSGAVVSKMKDRPLPPPPRPKRDNKKPKKDENDDGDDQNKFDKDDGAERIHSPLSVDVHQQDQEEAAEEESPVVVSLAQHNESYLPRQDSDFSEPEKVVEVDMSTQTDPVLDEDFACDDEDIDIEEFLSSDGKLKTLEDILKEEQEAEMERARQLAEAENLSRGIQRFRESNQRSLSERSRETGDRSRSLSRPITPSAVLVEQKKSSPVIFNNEPETVTEAGLFIHPITYDDFGRQASDEEEHQLSEPIVENLDHNNNLEAQVERVRFEEQQQEVPELPVFTQDFTEDIEGENELDAAILRVVESQRLKENYSSHTNESIDEELDLEMQRKIEEMIESVMASAREETELLRASEENIKNFESEIAAIEAEVEEFEPEIDEIEEIAPPQIEVESPAEEIEEPIEVVEVHHVMDAPKPPPRRKSQVDDSVKQEVDYSEEIAALDVIEETNEITSTTNELLPERDVEGSQYEPSPTPSRLHLSSLEIDSLSVNTLTAGRITASEIDSNLVTTNEFECKSNNAKSFELPPGLIDEIVERVRSAERESHANQEKSIDQAPVRPPLPQSLEFSNVPPTFYQLRNPSDDDQNVQAPTLTPASHRKRRQPSRRRNSTSEEEYQRDQRNKSRASGAAGTSSSDQSSSVMATGGQFMRACGNALRDSGGQLMAILRASSKDENKRDMHIALLILLIIVAGLMLLGGTDKSVHHHHWDFFNPPGKF